MSSYLQYGTPHVWLEDGVTCAHAEKHAPRWYCTWKNMMDTPSVSRNAEFATKEEAVEEAEKHIFNNSGMLYINDELVQHPNYKGNEEYIPF
jgi:hypothetical protein